MKKVVSIEIGVLFLFRYIVATIHSAVALGALQKLFKLEVGAVAVIVMGHLLAPSDCLFLVTKKVLFESDKKASNL